MREHLVRLLGNPWAAVLLVIATAALLWLAGGLLWTVGVGTLIKAGTALAAIVVAMAGLFLIRHIRGLSPWKDPGLDLIRSDPVALAISRGLFALGAFVLTGLIFS